MSDQRPSVLRSRHRRTAVALFGLGVLAVVITYLIRDSRSATVLLALGGSGLFLGVIYYYQFPNQFTSASVSEAVYTAYANAGTAMSGQRSRALFLPRRSESGPSVRLFIPKSGVDDQSDNDTLETDVLTVDGQAGVAYQPTGEELFPAFKRTLSEAPSDQPRLLAEQIADSVVNQFELAENVETTVYDDSGRVTVGLEDSHFGRVDYFDHPVPSLLAVGFVRVLDSPVEIHTEAISDDERFDYVISCQWDLD